MLGSNRGPLTEGATITPDEKRRIDSVTAEDPNVVFEYSLTQRKVKCGDIYPPPFDPSDTSALLQRDDPEELPRSMGDEYWPADAYKIPRHKKTSFLLESHVLMPGLFYCLHPEISLPAAGLYVYRMLTGDMVESNAIKFYKRQPECTAWLAKWWKMSQVAYVTAGSARQIPMGVKVRIYMSILLNLIQHREHANAPQGRLPYLSTADLTEAGVLTTAFDRTWSENMPEDMLKDLESTLDRLVTRRTHYPYSDLTVRRVCIFCNEIWSCVQDLADHVKTCVRAVNPRCLTCNMDFGRNGGMRYAAHVLSTCRARPTAKCCVCGENCGAGNICLCAENYFKVSEMLEQVLGTRDIYNSRNIPILKLIMECDLQQLLRFGPQDLAEQEGFQNDSSADSDRFITEPMIKKVIKNLPTIEQENPNHIFFPCLKKSFAVRDIYDIAKLSRSECRQWGLPEEPALLQIYTVHNPQATPGPRQEAARLVTFRDENISHIETDYVESCMLSREGMEHLRTFLIKCAGDRRYLDNAILQGMLTNEAHFVRWARELGVFGEAAPSAEAQATSTPRPATPPVRAQAQGPRHLSYGSAEELEVPPDEDGDPARPDMSQGYGHRDMADVSDCRDGADNGPSTGRESIGASGVHGESGRRSVSSGCRAAQEGESLLRCNNEQGRCRHLQFRSRQEKEDHINDHHGCTVSGCRFASEFERDLAEHVLDEHTMRDGQLRCRNEREDCTNLRFRSEDEKARHVVREHGCPYGWTSQSCTFACEFDRDMSEHLAHAHGANSPAPAVLRCRNERGLCSMLSFAEERDKAEHISRTHNCTEPGCLFASEFESLLLQHAQDTHGWTVPRARRLSRHEEALRESLPASSRGTSAGREDRHHVRSLFTSSPGVFIDPKAWDRRDRVIQLDGSTLRCTNERGACGHLTFKNELDKVRHIEKQHKCTKQRCDFSSESEKTLLAHYDTLHKDTGLVCPICGTRCTTQATWDAHTMTHPRCEGCKNSFVSRAALDSHRPCKIIRATDRVKSEESGVSPAMAVNQYLMPASVPEGNDKGINDPQTQMYNVWSYMIEQNKEISSSVKNELMTIVSDAHASEMGKRANALLPEAASYLSPECFDIPSFHPKSELRKVNWQHVNSRFTSDGITTGSIKLDSHPMHYGRNFVKILDLNNKIGFAVAQNCLSEEDAKHLLLTFLSPAVVQSLSGYLFNQPYKVSYCDNLYGLHTLYAKIDKDQLKKMILSVPRKEKQDIRAYAQMAFRLCEAGALQELKKDRPKFIESSMRRLILENVSPSIRQTIIERENKAGKRYNPQLLQDAVSTLETGHYKSHQRGTVMDPDLWLDPLAAADITPYEEGRRDRRQKIGAVTRKQAAQQDIQQEEGGQDVLEDQHSQGSRKCFNCDSETHLVKDCPEDQQGQGHRKCWTCDSREHLMRDCPSRPVPGRLAPGTGASPSLSGGGAPGAFQPEQPISPPPRVQGKQRAAARGGEQTHRLPPNQGMGQQPGRTVSAANAYNARDLYTSSRNSTADARAREREDLLGKMRLEEIDRKKLHLPPGPIGHCTRCGNDRHKAAECRMPESANVHRCKGPPNELYLFHEPQACPHAQKIRRVRREARNSGPPVVHR